MGDVGSESESGFFADRFSVPNVSNGHIVHDGWQIQGASALLFCLRGVKCHPAGRQSPLEGSCSHSGKCERPYQFTLLPVECW